MKAFIGALCAGDAGLFRACSGCDLVKSNMDFPKGKDSQDGRFPICKSCMTARAARWAKENPEKARVHRYKWREKNPDAARAISVRWIEANRAGERERARAYRDENRDEINLRARKKREDPVVRRDEIKYLIERRRASPKLRIDHAMSSGVRSSLVEGAKAGRKWESLVGYTIDDLRSHLEQQFLPGMTWDNYGRGGWHIDHKIPKSLFNYETPDDIDFRRCWALSNLQPLWEKDNLAKWAKYDKGFQPSLAL